MNKLKFLSWFALTVFSATAMWAENPIGSIDAVTGKNGSLYVNGWAIDPDDGSKTVEVHVYLFSSSTETNLANAVKGINGTYANLDRPDLKGDWGTSVGELYGTLHGFARTIDLYNIGVGAGTYYVRIYAINVAGSGGNPMLSYSAGGDVKSVTIGSPYTVSYNANGGTGAPDSQKKVQDVTLKLSSTKPTRTGYTFNGWNTNNSGTGTNYAAGANYTANASATLFAQWTANTYTVTFDKQNGTGGSNSVTATYASAMPSATMPTRAGYTFNGYFTGTSGSGTKYYNANGSSAKNWDQTSNKTLYASWSIVNYTIGYTLNGGSVSTNPSSYTIETNTITLNNPTKDGYTFKGWTGSNGNTPQTTVQITKGSTDNKTYTANWEKLTYTITYDYAGGSGLNVESYDVETATFTLNNPGRSGYTFAGWTGSNGNTPQTAVQIAKGSTGNKNYTAHWTLDPNTTVAYLDSLGMPAAQETVAFNRPEAPEIAGFTFLRWEVVEGPLSEGIKLQAIYSDNNLTGIVKPIVGKYTLIRRGDKNEYILK